MSEVKLNKTTKITGMALVLLFVVLLSLFQFYYTRQLLPVNPRDKKQIDIIIPDNSNARQIAALLKQKRLIRSESVFLTFARRDHLDNQLKAGHYRFARNQSVKEIAESIAEGRIVTKSFTIPEGFTVQQIGELLVSRHICTDKQWTAALQKDYNYDFLRKIAPGPHRLEGFLFPDTYSIPDNVTAEQIINIMLKNFDKVWKQDFAATASRKNMDLYKTVVVASMVEREAKLDRERKTIAGVIYNRLNRGMPLQIDATVVFALGVHKDTVTYQDLEINSPYNTYKYAGLPPGPISCPGKASIEAALNPEKHSYYYYLAQGDGSHYFSKTYAEHLKAKQKYIK
ncbi:MAG TPA: endolytic transglycosylase MltG [Syntrophomonadaceae bacterium]|nr:endolytic transglycosylase MltG [Syntrophomonadaceae bacterium]